MEAKVGDTGLYLIFGGGQKIGQIWHLPLACIFSLKASTGLWSTPRCILCSYSCLALLTTPTLVHESPRIVLISEPAEAVHLSVSIFCLILYKASSHVLKYYLDLLY